MNEHDANSDHDCQGDTPDPLLDVIVVEGPGDTTVRPMDPTIPLEWLRPFKPSRPQPPSPPAQP
jgi:hypothetical protein